MAQLFATRRAKWQHIKAVFAYTIGSIILAHIANFIENFQVAVDFQEAVDIQEDTLLADLPEWDSLAALGVIVMFDVEYGKVIVGDDIKRCITISDLYKLVG